VAFVRADVSEERIAFIIRVTRIGELAAIDRCEDVAFIRANVSRNVSPSSSG
jgi:hypothetical protein